MLYVTTSAVVFKCNHLTVFKRGCTWSVKQKIIISLLSRCEAKSNQIFHFFALLRRRRVSKKMLAQIANLRLCVLMSGLLCPAPLCQHPYVAFCDRAFSRTCRLRGPERPYELLHWFFPNLFKGHQQNWNPEKSNTLAAKKPFSHVIAFSLKHTNEVS